MNKACSHKNRTDENEFYLITLFQQTDILSYFSITQVHIEIDISHYQRLVFKVICSYGEYQPRGHQFYISLNKKRFQYIVVLNHKTHIFNWYQQHSDLPYKRCEKYVSFSPAPPMTSSIFERLIHEKHLYYCLKFTLSHNFLDITQFTIGTKCLIYICKRPRTLRLLLVSLLSSAPTESSIRSF